MSISNVEVAVSITMSRRCSVDYNLFTWTIISSALQKKNYDKEFRSQSIKTQFIVFGFYRTIHEIESAIKSPIRIDNFDMPNLCRNSVT